MKRKVRKQLLNLAIGEMAASGAFVFAYYTSRGGLASLMALGMLVFVLLQGSFYWLARYRYLFKMPSLIIRSMALSRKLDLVLLLVLPFVIVFVREGTVDLVVAASIYLFAVIEYINYFWYRLSYGRSGFNMKLLMVNGLKESSIRKLLRQSDGDIEHRS